jgi:hypothetical protein
MSRRCRGIDDGDHSAALVDRKRRVESASVDGAVPRGNIEIPAGDLWI